MILSFRSNKLVAKEYPIAGSLLTIEQGVDYADIYLISSDGIKLRITPSMFKKNRKKPVITTVNGRYTPRFFVYVSETLSVPYDEESYKELVNSFQKQTKCVSIKYYPRNKVAD